MLFRGRRVLFECDLKLASMLFGISEIISWGCSGHYFFSCTDEVSIDTGLPALRLAVEMLALFKTRKRRKP